MTVTDTQGKRLAELAALFLKLGTLAFGGPAAHLAMLQHEVVTRRKWLTNTEFLDMWAATNFIPGPNSTELAIHVGYRRAGWPGLLVAGACFILPAALMCSIIAAFYVAYGQSPVSTSILWGVKPIVIGVVGQALFKLGKSAVKTWVLAAIALLAVAALFFSVNELVVLAAGGAAAAILQNLTTRKPTGTTPALSVPLVPATLGAKGTAAIAATTAAGALAPVALGPLFLVFLKIGSVLFGSGYVLLAFLRADLVVHRRWLTNRQLLDAVAVGQVTPGPLFTTATFIGYVLAGPWGAVAATAGIFLPAFFFVGVSAPLLPRLRKSRLFGAFLDGLNVASLALMAVVLFQLAQEVIFPESAAGPAHYLDVPAIALAAASLTVLLWKNVNSIWLVLAGAALGAARAIFFHL